MKYAKFALAIGMCLLCGLAVVGVVQSGIPAAVSTAVRKAVCPYIGGRFGDASDRCFTRSCYARHDCGHWGDEHLRCAGLKAGAAIDEVYYQLGEPLSQEGSRYVWWNPKMEDTKILAEIEGGTLKSLSCSDFGAPKRAAR